MDDLYQIAHRNRRFGRTHIGVSRWLVSPDVV
jgi:hypothetical protein